MNNIAATKPLRGQQGPQGAQGDMGIPGEPGAPGAQGFQGESGGSQGYQGAQGNIGPDGAQGPIGVQGLQGDKGVQGDPGGAQGYQGDAGSQGSQGDTGAQGYQGNLGPQGLQGSGLNGTSDTLAAGDGSPVTVGTGLTLSGGTLTASGGGISQLSGDVLAGPGSGNVLTDIVQVTGNTVTGAGPLFQSKAVAYFRSDYAPSGIIRVGGDPGPYGWGNSNVVLSGRSQDGLFRTSIGQDPNDPQPGGATDTVILNAQNGNGSIFFYNAGVEMYRTATTATGYRGNNIRAALSYDHYEQFSDNYTTDSQGGPGSLVLEAAIPVGSGGKTLTIGPYPMIPHYGGRQGTGRVLFITDVLGTLSPTNPLTLNGSGRNFLVNGQPSSLSTFVMDQPYQSVTLMLTSDRSYWTVFTNTSQTGGAQGSQGYQGTQGTQGDPGVQGPQGDYGGPQGAQGAQGAQGSALAGSSTDLAAADGSAITVGSGLLLTPGIPGPIAVPPTLTATSQFTGTSSDLTAGDGTPVTVSSGLSLIAGTLKAGWQTTYEVDFTTLGSATFSTGTATIDGKTWEFYVPGGSSASLSATNGLQLAVSPVGGGGLVTIRARTPLVPLGAVTGRDEVLLWFYSTTSITNSGGESIVDYQIRDNNYSLTDNPTWSNMWARKGWLASGGGVPDAADYICVISKQDGQYIPPAANVYAVWTTANVNHDVFVIRYVDATTAELYTGAWTGSWPDFSTLTFRGYTTMQPYAAGGTNLAVPNPSQMAASFNAEAYNGTTDNTLGNLLRLRVQVK